MTYKCKRGEGKEKGGRIVMLEEAQRPKHLREGWDNRDRKPLHPEILRRPSGASAEELLQNDTPNRFFSFRCHETRIVRPKSPLIPL